MSYEVRTDVFEGPFDVLLRLITEQRVELYDICLRDIVDAFLAETDKIGHLDLEVATEFLLIAAILVELKSRRLLPSDDAISVDQDLDLIEERDYLLARLVECTTFSAAGRRLSELELAASHSHPRTLGPDERFFGLAPDLLAGVTATDVVCAAQKALTERPAPRVAVEHILVDEVTVAEAVEALLVRLCVSPRLTFRELTAHARSKIEIVAHFLALLELYKQGLVDLDQKQTLGELVVCFTGATGEAGEAGRAIKDGRLLAEVDYQG
ncbi:MAG: segregation and condensation protein A [Acidimicrobiales bacterium]